MSVDQLRERGGDGLLLELLADVAVVLACGRARAGRRRPGHRGPGGSAWPLSPARAVEALERQLVEDLGRDQVQLEDRLAEVAVVLLAVDLGRAHLLGGEQAPS